MNSDQRDSVKFKADEIRREKKLCERCDMPLYAAGELPKAWPEDWPLKAIEYIEHLEERRDELKHRSELWERLHYRQTKTLRSVEEKLNNVLRVLHSRDDYYVDRTMRPILDELKASIEDVVEEHSLADLAASGGIAGAR